MSDSPYLIQVPDREELWLVDRDRRFLITLRVYDLLASNGADLPPAYGIEELREQNAKLRELVRTIYMCSCIQCDRCEYGHGDSCSFDAESELRELGVEVDG